MSSSFIYIEDEDLQPEYQFVRTQISSKAREEYDLHLLPGQYIRQFKKGGTSNKFIKGDKTWKVSANKKNRNDYAVGSIFKIRGCSLFDNGRNQWVMTSDRDFFQPVEFSEAVDQIEKYTARITGEGFFEEELEEGEPTTGGAEEGSILEKVMEEHPVPSISKNGFYVSNNNWKVMARNIHRRKNTMIIGPSGTGKTEICSLLAKEFDLPIVIHDMAASQDPIATMIGVHRMEDGKSKFDVADFVEDIQTECVLLLDEINRAPLTANNLLFPLTDKRRVLKMSMADSNLDREVKVHDNLIFVATANIGNEFTGTNTLDAAFVNRFQLVKLGYPPPSTEEALLAKKTGIEKGYAKSIVKVATSIRKKKETEDISMEMSIRQTIEVAEMVYDGFSVKEALEFYLEPIFTEEWTEIKDILQSI
jgi:nitric oxide reductase NorQ protein